MRNIKGECKMNKSVLFRNELRDLLEKYSE